MNERTQKREMSPATGFEPTAPGWQLETVRSDLTGGARTGTFNRVNILAILYEFAKSLS